ncbi:MAG: DUF2270 domain-containing protein [Desulfobacteraceae bacterium]|nr:DUF2270 domain-containing protein [Desulfobacteraceae bacterium]
MSEKSNLIDHQIELLKLEMQFIDNTIGRIDNIAQGTKNWSIITWAGSIAIVIGKPELRPYIFLTGLLPLLFWYIDASWRRIQRRSAYRSNKITDYLNSESFIKSFDEKKLTDFIIYDPVGRQYSDSDEYKNYISMTRTLKFREVKLFYLSQFLVSLILEFLFIVIS